MIGGHSSNERELLCLSSKWRINTGGGRGAREGEKKLGSKKDSIRKESFAERESYFSPLCLKGYPHSGESIRKKGQGREEGT